MAKYVKKQVDTASIIYIEELKIWAVPSASNPEKVYEVSWPEQKKFVCNCPDYLTRHAAKETECKHGQAVRSLFVMATATP